MQLEEQPVWSQNTWIQSQLHHLFTFVFSTLVGEVLSIHQLFEYSKISPSYLTLCIQLQRTLHWACSEDVGCKYHHWVIHSVMSQRGTRTLSSSIKKYHGPQPQRCPILPWALPVVPASMIEWRLVKGHGKFFVIIDFQLHCVVVENMSVWCWFFGICWDFLSGLVHAQFL